MNKLMLHTIIEHIRGKGEFPFDVEDVDQDIGSVLGFFDILEEFDKDDTEVLREALRKLALEEEEAEASRLAIEAGWIPEDEQQAVSVEDEDEEEAPQ